MKTLIRAAAGALALAAVSFSTPDTTAKSIFNPTQPFFILSDNFWISCVYNVYDVQLWNTGWQEGDFWYLYTEYYTNQWTRHWLYDFDLDTWVYCFTVNYQNFNPY